MNEYEFELVLEQDGTCIRIQTLLYFNKLLNISQYYHIQERLYVAQCVTELRLLSDRYSFLKPIA